MPKKIPEVEFYDKDVKKTATFDGNRAHDLGCIRSML